MDDAAGGDRLGRAFFARDARTVARDLLGRVVVHEVEADGPGGPGGPVRLAGRIVETEAYLGEDDPASHARFGPTERAGIMWDTPGLVYVYLIYGAHHMLNFVTGAKGQAAAVLVRAVEPVEGLEAMRRRRGRSPSGTPPPDGDLTDGPGKLCQALGITLAHRGTDACATGSRLTVEPGRPVPDDRVRRTARVGVVADVEEPRRFVVAGTRWASR